MSITTTTHLNFRGTAGQALEFYQSVFGGSLTAATYGDFGMPNEVPGAEKIVFGQLETADGLEEVTEIWDGLADCADIIEPLAASAWSPGFGILTDRFGVTWVIDVEAAYEG